MKDFKHPFPNAERSGLIPPAVRNDGGAASVPTADNETAAPKPATPLEEAVFYLSSQIDDMEMLPFTLALRHGISAAQAQKVIEQAKQILATPPAVEGAREPIVATPDPQQVAAEAPEQPSTPQAVETQPEPDTTPSRFYRRVLALFLGVLVLGFAAPLDAGQRVVSSSVSVEIHVFVPETAAMAVVLNDDGKTATATVAVNLAEPTPIGVEYNGKMFSPLCGDAVCPAVAQAIRTITIPLEEGRLQEFELVLG